MKRRYYAWHDKVGRLQVGLSRRLRPPADGQVCLDAADVASLDRILQAIVTGKSAAAVGNGILAALDVQGGRSRARSRADWPARLRRLRGLLYDDNRISDTYTVPLIELLDQLIEGGTARALGDRALAFFGAAKRGRGRPKDETDNLAVDVVWNLYRLGIPIRDIEASTGWTMGSIRRVLNPLIAAFGRGRGEPLP